MRINRENSPRLENTGFECGYKYLNKLSNYKITMQALFLSI